MTDFSAQDNLVVLEATVYGVTGILAGGLVRFGSNLTRLVTKHDE